MKIWREVTEVRSSGRADCEAGQRLQQSREEAAAGPGLKLIIKYATDKKRQIF